MTRGFTQKLNRQIVEKNTIC